MDQVFQGRFFFLGPVCPVSLQILQVRLKQGQLRTAMMKMSKDSLRWNQEANKAKSNTVSQTLD